MDNTEIRNSIESVTRQLALGGITPEIKELASRAMFDLAGVDYDRRFETVEGDRKGETKTTRKLPTSDQDLLRDGAIRRGHEILSAISKGTIPPQAGDNLREIVKVLFDAVEAIPAGAGERAEKNRGAGAGDRIQRFLDKNKRKIKTLQPLWRIGDRQAIREGRMKYGQKAIGDAIGCNRSTVSRHKGWLVMVGQNLFPKTHKLALDATELTHYAEFHKESSAKREASRTK